ncbi:MAG: hypothetical protein QW587_04660 [Candidatus Bathyarchaeia archaeon]
MSSKAYIVVPSGWYQRAMAKRKATVRYEPQEKVRPFVLRLPERYILALDGLVERGAARSRNELIVDVVGRFLGDLQKEAEAKKSG